MTGVEGVAFPEVVNSAPLLNILQKMKVYFTLIDLTGT